MSDDLCKNKWRVRVDLGSLGTSLEDLCTPQRFSAGPKNSGGIFTVWRDPCLVLRGFSYVFSAAASGIGFDIRFSNRNVSPAVETVEWEVRTAAAGTLFGHVDDIEWHLPRSTYSGSPLGAGMIGGVLGALRVGTIASGTLQLWGTHGIPNDGGKMLGSPVTY